MIKYVELKGYSNSGEVGVFSHLYRFFERDSEDPVMIFIHAYEVTPTKVFKGRVHTETKSYKNIDLTLDEKETLEQSVGELHQTDFIDFANGHALLSFARTFTEEN
jgi:hypothetical protein